MLEKVRGDQLGTVDVTFELTPAVVADSAAVLGEFNGSPVEADPMERGGDDSVVSTNDVGD
jgi:hypothetical protein